MTTLHIPTVGPSKELWGSIRGTATESMLHVATGELVAKAKVHDLDIKVSIQSQVLWLWCLWPVPSWVTALNSRHYLEEFVIILFLFHVAVMQWVNNHLSFASIFHDQVESFLGPNHLKQFHDIGVIQDHFALDFKAKSLEKLCWSY